MKPVDVYEVLNNLGIICRGCKFTYEEHDYLRNGMAEIEKRLKELDALKAPKEEKPEEK